MHTNSLFIGLKILHYQPETIKNISSNEDNNENDVNLNEDLRFKFS